MYIDALDMRYLHLKTRCVFLAMLTFIIHMLNGLWVGGGGGVVGYTQAVPKL